MRRGYHQSNQQTSLFRTRMRKIDHKSKHQESQPSKEGSPKPIYHIRNLILTVSKNAESDLRLLTSSDFDSRSGLNEAGFKAILISEIHRNFLYKRIDCGRIQLQIVTIESEKRIGNGYADIVMEVDVFEDSVIERVTVILELKYLKGGYCVALKNASLTMDIHQKRMLQTEFINYFANVDSQKAAQFRFEYFNGTMTVYSFLQSEDLIDQTALYVKNYTDGQHVVGVPLVGAINRGFLSPIYVEKEPNTSLVCINKWLN